MTDAELTRSGLDPEPDDELAAERNIRQRLTAIVEADNRDERERSAGEIMRLVGDLAGQSQDGSVYRAEVDYLRGGINQLEAQVREIANALWCLSGGRVDLRTPRRPGEFRSSSRASMED